MKKRYNLTISFDDRSGRWFVESTDIPGLSLEAETPGAILHAIGDVADDLIHLNEGDQS